MAVIHGANMAWQLGGDARLLLLLAEDADALVLVECRTKDNRVIDVKKILGRGWWVGQDLSSPARGGTVIAIRKRGAIKRRRAVRVLRLIARRGRKLQDRYLRSVAVKDSDGPFELMGAHMPLASTGQQDEAFAELRHAWRARRGRKTIFLDGNARPARVAEELTAPNWSGNGVMVWCWSDGWGEPSVQWRKRKGSDHEVGTYDTKEKAHA